MQPSGSASLDEVVEDGCGEEVRDGEQHGRNAPLESASGSDRVEEPVGGHVAAQEVARGGAEGPDERSMATSCRGFGDKNFEGLTSSGGAILLRRATAHI